jgi:hypothetical protein
MYRATHEGEPPTGALPPPLTPMPGVHKRLERDAHYVRAPQPQALAVTKYARELHNLWLSVTP